MGGQSEVDLWLDHAIAVNHSYGRIEHLAKQLARLSWNEAGEVLNLTGGDAGKRGQVRSGKRPGPRGGSMQEDEWEAYQQLIARCGGLASAKAFMTRVADAGGSQWFMDMIGDVSMAQVGETTKALRRTGLSNHIDVKELGIAMQSLSDIGGPAVFDCFRYLLADSGWRHSDVYANVMCV